MEKAFENDRIYTGLTFSKKDKESRCDDKTVVVSVYVNDDKTTLFERRNRTRIVAISLTLFAIAIFILLYTMFVKSNASTNKGESRSKCVHCKMSANLHQISPAPKIQIFDLPYMILARSFDACFG